MLELAAHILDITENSIRAGAKLIKIKIDENKEKDILCIEIKDNGTGMTKEEIKKAIDPYLHNKESKASRIRSSASCQRRKKSGRQPYIEISKRQRH